MRAIIDNGAARARIKIDLGHRPFCNLCGPRGPSLFIMRFHILSDLHVEFWGGKKVIDIPRVDADAVVLAGDIHNREKGIDWISQNFPHNRKVIYVPGNHEYYGDAYPHTL